MHNLNNSFVKPRIVVTGALSYLGQHLWRALKRDGWHPVAIVRDGSEERAREADIPKDDLYTLPADPRIWTNFLTQLSPDAAIHLAAINASKNFADDDLFAIHLVNIYLPVCLAQALARSRCAKTAPISYLILAGSHWQTVDGKPHDPLDHYAASKQAAEEMLRPIAAEQAGIGGGQGEISDWFVEVLNCKCDVFDYGSSNKSCKPGLNIVGEIDSNIEYNFIMCNHVLEHVNHPAEFLKPFIAHSNQNTIFYFEIPFELIRRP